MFANGTGTISMSFLRAYKIIIITIR